MPKVQFDQGHYPHEAIRRAKKSVIPKWNLDGTVKRIKQESSLEGQRERRMLCRHCGEVVNTPLHIFTNGKEHSDVPLFIFFLPILASQGMYFQLRQKQCLCRVTVFWHFASTKPLTWIRPCFCKSALSINPERTHGWVACGPISQAR